MLCRYVGTNVIAATKIVKKHDKHVQPSLRKRVVVGNIIRSSKVLAELVQYSSTVQRGGAPSSKVTPSDNGVAPTKEEAEMRGLPDWLLSGAKENDAASETSSKATDSRHASAVCSSPGVCFWIFYTVHIPHSILYTSFYIVYLSHCILCFRFRLTRGRMLRSPWTLN